MKTVTDGTGPGFVTMDIFHGQNDLGVGEKGNFVPCHVVLSMVPEIEAGRIGVR